ncbi:MAG TPA: hypothetical protein VFJ72_14960, partial [Rubrobacteraceae bacterium]|nr:hypothetical protein [Rubrobacteraceae bacterium]
MLVRRGLLSSFLGGLLRSQFLSRSLFGSSLLGGGLFGGSLLGGGLFGGLLSSGLFYRGLFGGVTGLLGGGLSLLRPLLGSGALIGFLLSSLLLGEFC